MEKKDQISSYDFWIKAELDLIQGRAAQHLALQAIIGLVFLNADKFNGTGPAARILLALVGLWVAVIALMGILASFSTIKDKKAPRDELALNEFPLNKAPGVRTAFQLNWGKLCSLVGPIALGIVWLLIFIWGVTCLCQGK